MRFTSECLVYAILALSSEAFTTHKKSSSFRSSSATVESSTTALFRSLHGGWDNDSFMDSLGQGQAEQQQATDEYYEMSKYGRPEDQPWATAYNPPPPPPPPPPPMETTPSGDTETVVAQQVAEDGSTLLPAQDVTGAAFASAQVEEIKSFHQAPEEESSQGGQMFRNLMKRAKQTAAVQLSTPQQPVPPDAMMELSIEEQARLFREIMMQRQMQFQQQPPQQPQSNPYAQQQQPPPPSPYGQPQQYSQQPPPPNPYGAPQQQQNPDGGQPQPPPQQPASDPYSQQLAAYGGQQQQQPSQPAPQQTTASDPYSQQLAAAYAQQGQQQMPKAGNNPTPQPQPPPSTTNPYGATTTNTPASLSDPYAQQQQQQQMQRQQQLQQQQQQQANNPYTPQPQPPIYPGQQQQQQQPQMQQRSNYLEPGVGFDGRRIGRNKDADVIANTGDAYFAQLKRDSTIRNYARYAGDDVKANDVFHDPSIQDIKAPEDNPYRQEQRQKERDMLETVPEEMLLFQEYTDANADTTEQAAKKVLSYKDKLAQFKAKKKATGGGNGGGGGPAGPM